MQMTLTAKEDDCYLRDDLPTLQGVADAYGRGKAALWIYGHLVNAAEYSKVPKPADGFPELKECAKALLVTYADFNPLEVLLFFRKFKAGLYGKFYGAADPLVIAEGFKKFKEDRAAASARVSRERREAERRAREAADAAVERFSYDEYRRRIQAARNPETTETPL